MPNKKKKIIYVMRDDGGCGYFRCKQPATFLQRSGLIDAESIFRNPSHADLLSADLVVMQEMGSVEASNMAKFMRENNIPYVTEFDDFVLHVSPHNQAGYMAWNPSTLYLHRALEMTKQGVGIIVSTPALAREMFAYSNLVYVVPNYLNKDKWDIPAVRRTDGKIRIGWCGGNAHADDLFMISKVLDKIVKEYKGKVIFETMGMTRQELAGVFPLEIHNEVCPSCGFEGELHHYPGESLEDYPIVLASKGWDIAVAPVIDNSFGNCKSDIKIKEYSAIGLPIVASPVKPYVGAAEDGAQISFATTFEEWYKALKDLIENVEKRQEMGRINKEWVAKYWIQDNVDKIYEMFRQILSVTEPVLGTKEHRNKKASLVK